MSSPVPSNEGSVPTEFPRIRWVVFSLVFFGIPVLLAAFGFQQIAAERENARHLQQEQRLETAVSYLQTQCRFEPYFERLLNKMSQRVFASLDSQKAFADASQSLRRAFPGLLEFTFLDGKGLLVDHLSDGVPYRSLWKSFFQEYDKLRYGHGEAVLTKRWASFAPLLGPLVKPRALQDNRIDLASAGDRHTWVFVSPMFSTGMFICHINRLPGHDLLPLKNRVEWLNQRQSDLRLGVVDLAAPLASQAIDPSLPPEFFPKVVATLESSPAEVVCLEGRIWSRRLFTPNTRLYGVCQKDIDPGREISRFRLLIGLMLLFSGATWLSLLVMLGEWRFYVSIRVRLVFLFCYVSGLPLTVLALHGQDFLLEREKGLRTKLHHEIQKALQIFDLNLPQQTGRLQTLISTALKTPVSPRRPALEQYLKRIRRICDKVYTRAAYAVDENGNYHPAFPGLLPKSDEQTIRLALPFYKKLLRRLNDDSDESDSPNEEATQGVLSMAGVDINDLFGTISAGMNQIVEYTMGNQQSLLAIYPIFMGGRAEYLAVMGWSQHRYEQAYIQHGLKRLERRLPNTRLAAANSLHRGEEFPPELPFPQLLKPFFRQLRTQTQPLQRFIRMRTGSFLLTGIRGNSLREFDLVAVTTDDQIRSELSDVRWRIWFLSLSFLLISGTVGAFLARKFLQPVENLSRGVEAIRTRNFEVRLPVLDQDELGDLSQTFNDVLSGLADLEIARVVQESLLPSHPLNVENVSIHGSCTPASQAGGDYFDYILLADGKIGIIVGDVAGHGVGAAMVSSMAKGLFTLLIRQCSDPAEVLSRMGAVLHESLRGHRLMTCFVAVLDPQSGVFLGCNAGHCYPYFVRNRKVSECKGSSFPLGTRRMRSFSLPPMHLQSGDSIVLYTDGIYETLARDGQMIGFSRLETGVGNSIGATPEESIRRLQQWYKEIAHPEIPQQDDLTLVVITYRG